MDEGNRRHQDDHIVCSLTRSGQLSLTGRQMTEQRAGWAEHVFSLDVLDLKCKRRFAGFRICMAHTHVLGVSLAFTVLLTGPLVQSMFPDPAALAVSLSGRQNLRPHSRPAESQSAFYQNCQAISMHIKLEKNCWNILKN